MEIRNVCQRNAEENSYKEGLGRNNDSTCANCRIQEGTSWSDVSSPLFRESKTPFRPAMLYTYHACENTLENAKLASSDFCTSRSIFRNQHQVICEVRHSTYLRVREDR